MAISTRVEPINRDIELMISEELSPKAQSQQFAMLAGEQINEAKQTNQTILGRLPRYTVSVDGNQGAALESVRPDGYAIVEFEVFAGALTWIADQLQKHSPVGSGRDPHPGLYRRSHALFADGQEIDAGGAIPPAEVYTFISDVPYARKIEGGPGKKRLSSQAPDGVYQAVAVLAARKYREVAHISFTFRPLMGGHIGAWASTTKMSSKGHASSAGRAEWLTRQPAIIVRASRDTR